MVQMTVEIYIKLLASIIFTTFNEDEIFSLRQTELFQNFKFLIFKKINSPTF